MVTKELGKDALQELLQLRVGRNSDGFPSVTFSIGIECKSLRELNTDRASAYTYARLQSLRRRRLKSRRMDQKILMRLCASLIRMNRHR
jgi:hypothetical protein